LFERGTLVFSLKSQSQSLALGADFFQGSGVPKWATSADRKRGRTGQEKKKKQ